MPTRTVARALGLVAATAALAVPATAFAAGGPTVTVDDGTYTLVVDSHTTDQTFTPKGGTPTTEEPKSAPKPGDSFSFVDTVTQEGKKVGSDKGTCTVLEDGKSGHCDVHVTFADGTLHVEGRVDFSEQGNSTTKFPVVGGTGAYAGAVGSALVHDVNDTDSHITVTYTLSGGQVSEVPSGGAAAGDGSTAGTENPWLFGLGAAGVLAGTALFGGAARRARRSS